MFGQFGVTGDLALQQVESLSGGKRAGSPSQSSAASVRTSWCSVRSGCTAIPTILYCTSD